MRDVVMTAVGGDTAGVRAPSADPRAPSVDAREPDPFSIGLGVIGAIAGAAAWLETRRQRRAEDERQRRAFRTAWFQCRRSVEFLRHVVSELETHVLERDFGERTFRFGSVRLTFESERERQSFLRLSRQIDLTKSNLTENFDELSNHLSPEDAVLVDQLLDTVSLLVVTPDRYAGIVAAGREAVAAFDRFLAGLDEREGFTRAA